MAQILYAGTRKLYFKLVNEQNTREKLSYLEVHHGETYAHSLRVGLLSIDLGYENFEWEDDLKNLGRAGLLHDIGKLKVPINILSKEGELTEEEVGILSNHPSLGFLELNEIDYSLVRKIVVAHHEYKPNPYPRKNDENNKEVDRRGNDPFVSACSQIVAVSDMFDALVSRRVYKPEFELPKIEEILKEQFKGNKKYVKQILKRY